MKWAWQESRTRHALLCDDEVGLESNDVAAQLLNVLLFELKQPREVNLRGDLHIGLQGSKVNTLAPCQTHQPANLAPRQTHKHTWLSPFLYSSGQSRRTMRGFSMRLEGRREEKGGGVRREEEEGGGRREEGEGRRREEDGGGGEGEGHAAPTSSSVSG